MSEEVASTQKSSDKILEVGLNNEEQKLAASNKYPKIVFLIIINEFCERFSFYGFRTVLYIFFTGFLKIEKDTATAIYHAFTMLCYFTPILGAVIADGYIGLYKTIFSLSIFYAIGQVVLTVTSIGPLGAPNIVGPMIGLVIIAIGTGGIKPCVSAFGGNQFGSNQKTYLAGFFSLFYLSINIGSTIGTLLTPIFRSDVKCFDNDCYPLAFGVPAGLMFISVFVFAAGTPFYRRDNDKPKGSQNVIASTFCCVFEALHEKIANGRKVKYDHWLDYAGKKYSKKMISDVKIFCKVVFVFLPLPLFWTLFDQQGSRWTSQAQQLDGRLGSWTIKPDQFQAINPILIVCLVPVFDFVIYPLFAKINFLKNYLQRISVGLVFTIISFLISALLEYQMQQAFTSNNSPTKISLANLSPCQFQMSHSTETIEVLRSEYLKNFEQPLPNSFTNDLTKTINFAEKAYQISGKCFLENNKEISFNKSIVVNNENLPKRLVFYFDYTIQQIDLLDYDYNLTPPEIGFSDIRYVYLNSENKSSMFTPIMESNAVKYTNIRVQNFKNKSEEMYSKVDYSEYEFSILDESKNNVLKNEFRLENGGKYTILLFSNSLNETSIDYMFLTDVYPNGIHLCWQLIQIFVITAGEIMVSISGLAFAYSEAPQSMKSVISAVWLLTVAVGNFVVVVVAEARFVPDQVYEYLLFAGLLVVALVLFVAISFFYKYTTDEEKKEVGIKNEAFENNSELISKENNSKTSF